MYEFLGVIPEDDCLISYVDGESLNGSTVVDHACCMVCLLGWVNDYAE